MYYLWFVVLGLGLATPVFVILSVILGRIFDYAWILTCFCGLATLAGFLTLFCLAIINPLVARNEYNEFLETKVLVEQIYQGNNDQYENAGLNTKIIELNQWLAHAKSEKKQWGNWSMYCNVDVENLDYIVLGGVQ